MENIKNVITKSSIDQLDSYMNSRNLTDVKISSNELDVKDQKKECRKIDKVIARASREFKLDFQSLNKKDFDIKKLKRYDNLLTAYNIAKENNDQYSKLYCELFEYMTGSKCRELVKNIKNKKYSSEGLGRIISGSVTMAINPVLNYLAVALTVAIVIIAIMAMFIIIFEYKRYRLERERGDRGVRFDEFMDNEHSYIVNGIIKPAKPIVKFMSKFSDNSSRILSTFKSDTDKLRKESGEFVFQAIVVIIGFILFVKFLKWTLGFIINLKLSIYEFVEDSSEVLRYRVEELDRELNDPTTSKARKDAVNKIRTKLIKDLELLEKIASKMGPDEQKAYAETVNDEIEDDKEVESESQQNDDEPSEGPAPIFL